MAAAHAQHFFHAQIKMNPHSTIQVPELYHAWRVSKQDQKPHGTESCLEQTIITHQCQGIADGNEN